MMFTLAIFTDMRPLPAGQAGRAPGALPLVSPWSRA